MRPKYTFEAEELIRQVNVQMYAYPNRTIYSATHKVIGRDVDEELEDRAMISIIDQIQDFLFDTMEEGCLYYDQGIFAL